MEEEPCTLPCLRNCRKKFLSVLRKKSKVTPSLNPVSKPLCITITRNLPETFCLGTNSLLMAQLGGCGVVRPLSLSSSSSSKDMLILPKFRCNWDMFETAGAEQRRAPPQCLTEGSGKIAGSEPRRFKDSTPPCNPWKAASDPHRLEAGVSEIC